MMDPMILMKKTGAYLLLLVLLPIVGAQPGLTILSPTEGETIPGDTITVTFNTQDIESSLEPVHLHLTLDGEAPRMHFSLEPYTFTNVAPGSHVLLAEIVNANHVPLPNPEAHTFVSFATSSVESVPQTVPSETVPETWSVPIGQVYEAVSETNTCTNGVQDSGEEGVDCGITCGVPCPTIAAQPEEITTSPEVPIGEAGGYTQRIMFAVKGSLTSIFILLLAAGAIVGAYFGYTKLYQGHYMGVPEEVQFNAQLYAYIKECTEKGFSREAVYNKLRQLNFKDKDLDYHFSLIEEKSK